MSALRQKMIEDMQLRGFAVRTQEAYLLAVRQLARHYHKSPDQINEEELRQYFLFLKNEKQAARATCTIALCGIKFFFQHPLRNTAHRPTRHQPCAKSSVPNVASSCSSSKLWPPFFVVLHELAVCSSLEPDSCDSCFPAVPVFVFLFPI
jgi:hypothetical protein